jgi:hypothetical protein
MKSKPPLRKATLRSDLTIVRSFFCSNSNRFIESVSTPTAVAAKATTTETTKA